MEVRRCGPEAEGALNGAKLQVQVQLVDGGLERRVQTGHVDESCSRADAEREVVGRVSTDQVHFWERLQEQGAPVVVSLRSERVAKQEGCSIVHREY